MDLANAVSWIEVVSCGLVGARSQGKERGPSSPGPRLGPSERVMLLYQLIKHKETLGQGRRAVL
jgi:hypothetical protein